MPKIVYLFPDTNLLIQCRPLEELDWEIWKDFDEIHLVICRAVQAEIDKHKNFGNDRLAKRGRKAATLLRDLIIGSSDHLVAREAAPRVKLFIRTYIKPSQALDDRLDYGERDDQARRHRPLVHFTESGMPMREFSRTTMGRWRAQKWWVSPST